MNGRWFHYAYLDSALRWCIDNGDLWNIFVGYQRCPLSPIKRLNGVEILGRRNDWRSLTHRRTFLVSLNIDLTVLCKQTDVNQPESGRRRDIYKNKLEDARLEIGRCALLLQNNHQPVLCRLGDKVFFDDFQGISVFK